MSARIRYQVILGVVWFPMAALGLVGLMTWLQQRSRAAMPVVALVSLVSVLPGLELLRHPDMEVQQWDAFKGMIDGLPDQAIVVVPPAGKRTREGFPVALARDNGKSILIVPATSEGKVPPLVMNTNRSVYYLRSISCGLNPSIGPPCEERVKNRELIREYVLEDKIRRESSFYRFPYRDPSRVALYKLY